MIAIIGKKLGMTRIFDEHGNTAAVTLIEIQDNVVTQVKTLEKDGYKAIQIGLKDDQKINKPLKGHLASSKTSTRVLKEFALDREKVGEIISLDDFTLGDVISVSALSRGKGFMGTVKRHHFHTGPKTHGSDNYRQPGSIGSMYPQRVIKGRKMAGHMGHERTTVKNLKVMDINPQDKILAVRGAVPGPTKSLVYLWKK